MLPRRRRHPGRPRHLAVVLLALAVGASACTDGGPTPPVAPPAVQTDRAAAATGGLAVVLPPADGLAEAERLRLRLLVERALGEAVTDGDGSTDVAILEPADAVSLLDTVEVAVRRVGEGGTVCVLGADVAARIAPVMALYPATRACVVPAVPGSDPEATGWPSLGADVDLEGLGRRLGAAARSVAGDGTVLVVAGGDVLLDRRWRTGIEDGAGPAAASAGALVVLTGATEVVALLDAQAALLAEGIMPGGPEARQVEGGAPTAELPEEEDLPAALLLPPVRAVILDASPAAGQLLGPLADRGIAVLAPRSLLLADGSPDGGVALRWRVRWDVVLGGLLRSALDRGEAPGATDDVIVLEAGPAFAGP